MMQRQLENILRALAYKSDAETAGRETALTQCEEYYKAGYQDALESMARACGLRPAGRLIDEQKGQESENGR